MLVTNREKFASKRVMIIDDLEGMRAQLKSSLSTFGFSKLNVLGSITEGISFLEREHYDLILCDYFLGDGTDGQQFLEYLRTKDLISRNTIFILITAEQALEKVISASECAPDDYLLKPFTTAQLEARLEKLLDRQLKLAHIDRANDAKDWNTVVTECDKLIKARDKYFVDACKIKGAALIHGGRPKEAVELYREVLAMRPIGWAKLGLARALSMIGEKAEALRIGKEILAESPRFMGVYDFLGDLLVSSGEKQGALQVLQKAREMAPGTMSRIRNIGHLAVTTGQPELAETIMRETLNKHKFSPVREANDYAILTKALTNQGKANEALDVVKNARASFDDDNSKVVLAATESMAHQAAGNAAQAEAALKEAMGGDLTHVPPGVATAVVEACFAAGKEGEAIALLKQVVQNNPDDPAVLARIQDALEATGRSTEECKTLISDSAKEIIQLNNDGVRKAESGKLDEAIALLSDAANRLPNNQQIVSNAALVLALYLSRKPGDEGRKQECLRFRELLLSKAPNHPKLARIDGLLKQVNLLPL